MTANGVASNVGGLAGYSENGITSSYATGAVTANGTGNCVGGLVGFSSGAISLCYSTGTVMAEGAAILGGLIGSQDGALTDSYSLSFVKGNAYAYVGGLIGVLVEDPGKPKPAPVGCFYLKENVMNIDLWGIGTTMERLDGDAVYTPSIDEVPGVTPLTSAQMTDKDSFTDWDFSAEWKVVGEENSPSLIWQQENHPVPVVASWLTGKGTEDDPFLIYTAEDLAALRYYLDERSEGKFFSLEQDIDLKDFLSEDGAGYNYRQGWDPIGETRMEKFSGTFLGNGKKIQNLWINRTRESYVGLFSAIASGAEIKDLTIELAEEGDQIGISGDDMVGGLAGANEGVITSCRVFGTLKSKQNIGGLVGENVGNITSGFFSGTIESEGKHVGGLTGTNKGTITACSAEGRATVGESGLMIGGLVGSNEEGGVITTSHADVAVLAGEGSYRVQVGGLLGGNYGKVTSCYATGAVTSNGISVYAGGLVGYSVNEITSCYATGAVTVNGSWSVVGGLIGLAGRTVSTCYFMGTVAVKPWVDSAGGLIGVWYKETENSTPAPSDCFYYKNGETNTDLLGISDITSDPIISNPLGSETPGASPLNDLRMTAQSSFTNWDFQNVWVIREGQTAPYFSWQSEPYPVLTKEKENAVYYTITLEIDNAIRCNYAAGQLSVAEGDHLYLQFQPEDATRTAADVILLIDGIETAFKDSGSNHSFSYILNPIEGDHTIEIRLREEGTGNADLNTDTIRLSVLGSQLLVLNTGNAVDLVVYTVGGQQIISLPAFQGTKTIRLTPGIYIVRAGTQTFKVGVN